MSNDVEKNVQEQEGKVGSCFLWFFWGLSISFLSILAIVLMVLLVASASLNAYLGWEIAGLEMSISRSGDEASIESIPIPTEILAAIPTNTPAANITAPVTEPTESPLESQVATVAALATAVSGANTPVSAEPIAPTPTTTVIVPTADSISEQTPTNTPAPSPAESEVPSATSTPAAVANAQEYVPPETSSNTYQLIPIDKREDRPAAEHGDLNLELRDPQPIDAELALQDVSGSGVDPDAPNFGKIFEPNFTGAYTIHNWDWGTNAKGALLKEDGLVLIGIKTTPGEPIFIPHKKQDIYDGKYFAVVLYASDDSLTFSYSRAGNAAKGYVVHYQGLHTDPNLVALFEESKGNELPGLTLDTPVGVASDDLIVAIRDNGTFLDARSLKDWWD
jgi:hypothetical protein